MPYYPSNNRCAELGCKQPRSRINSYCIEHGGLQHTNLGKEDAYNNPAWKTIRRIQLSKQPLCQSCLNRGTVSSAKHVDHVFPWRQIGEHAFLNNVFQSLCHECHSYKTGKERNGVIIYFDQKENKSLTLNDYPLAMSMINRGEKF